MVGTAFAPTAGANGGELDDAPSAHAIERLAITATPTMSKEGSAAVIRSYWDRLPLLSALLSVTAYDGEPPPGVLARIEPPPRARRGIPSLSRRIAPALKAVSTP
jgi:hypothetical protein